MQEVRYKGEGATTIGSGEEKFKFWYSGCMAGGCGVGVLVRHELAGSVVEVERFSHRVMKVKTVIGKLLNFTIFFGICSIGGEVELGEE